MISGMLIIEEKREHQDNNATDTFDVIVAGSGAAGMTAAIRAASLGAKVLVVEKAELIGGATAWSAGGVWIPNNPHMADVGAIDTREAAETYPSQRIVACVRRTQFGFSLNQRALDPLQRLI